jgi:hypothetical protein
MVYVRADFTAFVRNHKLTMRIHQVTLPSPERGKCEVFFTGQHGTLQCIPDMSVRIQARLLNAQVAMKIGLRGPQVLVKEGAFTYRGKMGREFQK